MLRPCLHVGQQSIFPHFLVNLTKISGKTSFKSDPFMQPGSLQSRGVICANRMAERIGHKGIEIEKYLETVGLILRQITNATVSGDVP